MSKSTISTFELFSLIPDAEPAHADEAQIVHMVERFLTWRLPETFNPDGGISFKRDYNEHTPFPMKHEPMGTNLFGYEEAKAMVLHMLEGLPGNSVVDEIAAERKRQIEAEGWAPWHDDEHTGGELALAGACYALASTGSPQAAVHWPFDVNWWKPKDRRSNLIRAAALIVAEIERLDRLTATDAERCIACAQPFQADDMVLHDESGGFIHTACCGPERNGYVSNGEPLAEGQPIPVGTRWSDRDQPIDVDRLREDREERDRLDREYGQ